MYFFCLRVISLKTVAKIGASSTAKVGRRQVGWTQSTYRLLSPSPEAGPPFLWAGPGTRVQWRPVLISSSCSLHPARLWAMYTSLWIRQPACPISSPPSPPIPFEQHLVGRGVTFQAYGWLGGEVSSEVLEQGLPGMRSRTMTYRRDMGSGWTCLPDSDTAHPVRRAQPGEQRGPF